MSYPQGYPQFLWTNIVSSLGGGTPRRIAGGIAHYYQGVQQVYS
ncbi:MAG: hypothetical protein WAN46_18505 [Gammaproteobacteria bacterium]